MELKLGNEKKYAITSLKEDMIPTSGGGNAWSLRFLISQCVNSDDIETNFTTDNISTIIVTADDGKTEKTFNGYKRIANASIVFDTVALTSVCQVHLQKVAE